MLTKLMNGFSFLLGGTGTNADTGTGTIKAPTTGTGWTDSILKSIVKVVNELLWPIFGVVAVLGIVYAVILGVNYAKAETTDKKEEAKKRIINAVVGVVVMLALIAVLKVFINEIDAVKTWVNGITGT